MLNAKLLASDPRLRAIKRMVEGGRYDLDARFSAIVDYAMGRGSSGPQRPVQVQRFRG